MGDPKKQRKKYETPRFPWQIDVLENELKLLGQYGLRNKKELWRHKTMVSKFRGTARSLLGMSTGDRRIIEKQLLGKLHRLGVLPENAVLDNVLDLSVEDVLERRLQTLVHRRSLAKSINQSRQLIAYGHVAIDGKRVSSPSYLVPRLEESKIDYSPNSPLSTPDHPLRKSIEVPAETKTQLEPEEGKS